MRIGHQMQIAGVGYNNNNNGNNYNNNKREEARKYKGKQKQEQQLQMLSSPNKSQQTLQNNFMRENEATFCTG